MNKNAASNGKKLALRVETLRNLNAKEMNEIRGGMPNTICLTIIIPSSGITTTIGVYTDIC